MCCMILSVSEVASPTRSSLLKGILNITFMFLFQMCEPLFHFFLFFLPVVPLIPKNRDYYPQIPKELDFYRRMPKKQIDFTNFKF